MEITSGGTRSLRLAGLVTLLSLLVPAERGDASPEPLERYAAGTWASFVAMTDEQSGLPADMLKADGTRSVQTSTTNIGAYMWSALVAERLGIIGHGETVERLGKTLDDARAHGAPRAERPVLQLVRPPHRGEADDLAADRRAARAASSPRSTTAGSRPGCGSWRAACPSCGRAPARSSTRWTSASTTGPRSTGSCSTTRPTLATRPAATTRSSRESRIASYIGIAKGELPQRHYFGAGASFPDTCDWSWQETRPVGFHRTLLRRDVFEGAYPYNGTRVTPSWGGSMFEALMPALFVPEERWGPRQLGLQPPADRARADPPRADRGGLRLLGLLAGQHPRGRLQRVRRRRDRHGPERQPVQRGPHARRPRLRRAAPAASRSPTRRRPRTPTAS